MAAVTHINGLPDHLLVRIWRSTRDTSFEGGVDFNSPCVPLPTPNADPVFNLAIAAVCRRWRRLARESVTALLVKDSVCFSREDLSVAISCFRNLSHLHLCSSSVETLDDAFLAHLASSCPKLTALHVMSGITPLLIDFQELFFPESPACRISEHPVTHEGLDRFLRLSVELKELSLFCLHPAAQLPDSFFRLTRLRSLGLSDERVLQMPQFQKFSSLTALNIASSRLNLEHLSSLLHITRLTSLSIACPSDRFRQARNATAFDLGAQRSLKQLTFNGSCPSFDLLFASGAPATCLEQLRIANCDFIQRLPEDIHKLLPNLRGLVIHMCHSLTTLPLKLTALNRLEHLKFDTPGPLRQSVSLPARFEPFTALKRLVLHLQLADLPDSVCQLPLLEELTFSSSSVRRLPAEFGRLTTLNTLDLCGPHELLLPASFTQLSSLTSLHLAGLNLQHSPADVGKLCGLQELYISNCRIRNVSKSITGITSLRVLSFRRCDQLTTLPRRLDRMKWLRVPEVTECGRLACVPLSFPTSLESLTLERLRPRNVSGLSNLRDLRLLLDGSEGGAMVGSGVVSCSLAQLTRLELSLTESVKQFPLWLDHLPQLRKLVFLHTGGMEDLPSDMSSMMPRLRKLCFVDAPELKALPDRITQLQHLTSLKFSSAPKLASLPRDIGALTSLRAICLFSCGGVQRLPDSFTRLRSLYDLKIYDGSIRQLPDNFAQLSRLRRLQLNCCHELAALPGDFTQLKLLQEFDLVECELLIDSEGRVRPSAIEGMYGLDLFIQS